MCGRLLVLALRKIRPPQRIRTLGGDLPLLAGAVISSLEHAIARRAEFIVGIPVRPRRTIGELFSDSEVERNILQSPAPVPVYVVSIGRLMVMMRDIAREFGFSPTGRLIDDIDAIFEDHDRHTCARKTQRV